MNKNEFIEKIGNIVRNENNKRGKPLFNSVVIAQACLETGFGQSKLMMKSNGIFGIKATSGWKGKIYNSKTSEFYDGKTRTIINSDFRAYNSIEESVSDYFDLITKAERYKKAIKASNALACITAIRNGGYATSPNYIHYIMNIIYNNNLSRFDEEIYQNKPDIEKMALEVIHGKYGIGEERRKRLGNLYDEVQKRVNILMNVQNKPDIEKMARDVIAGKYGNGQERKNKLGNLYDEVQKKVNELLRK